MAELNGNEQLAVNVESHEQFRLRALIAELLCENQTLRFDIRNTRDKLEEVEATVFRVGSSDCFCTSTEALMVLRSLFQREDQYA